MKMIWTQLLSRASSERLFELCSDILKNDMLSVNKFIYELDSEFASLISFSGLKVASYCMTSLDEIMYVFWTHWIYPWIKTLSILERSCSLQSDR